MRIEKFSTRLIKNLIIIILIPILIGWGLVYLDRKDYYTKEALAENKIVINNMSDYINEYLDHAEDTIKLIGTDFDQDHIEGNEANYDSKGLIYSHRDNFDKKMFEIIEIISVNGKILDAYPESISIIGADRSGLKYFNELKSEGDEYWTSTYISPKTGEPTIIYSRRFEDIILVGYLNINKISGLSNNLEENYNKKIYIEVVDKNGTYISSFNSNYVDQRRRIDLFDEIKKSVGNEQYSVVNHDNNISYMHSQFIDNAGWYLAGFVPFSQIDKSLDRVNNTFLEFIILFFILLMFYSIYEIRMVSNEIDKLRGHTKNIAEGNFKEKFDFNALDEFKPLIRDFRLMKNNLHRRDVKLKRLAFHDTLTNNFNKKYIYKKMEELINNNKNFAMVFLDFENFGRINKLYSHRIGDLSLITIGDNLEKITSNDAIVSRLWGDKFGIILKNKSNKKEIESELLKINRIFEEPITVENNKIKFNVNLGVSLYPKHGKTKGEIIQNVDTAVIEAKENKELPYVIFNKDMNLKIKRKIAIVEQLEDALEKNEFYLNYQPQYRLDDNKIIGFEALIRWENKKLGKVSPNEFIDIAEESGKILEIGRWVIDQSIKATKKINENAKDNYKISINVSPIQFEKEDFAEQVINIANKYNFDKNLIELEITEQVLINNIYEVNRNVDKLKKEKIEIALDDFGTGYSSLSYLSEFPIDTIKIDKSLIDDLENLKRKWTIIQSINDASKRLDTCLVLEGVETESQIELLAKLGKQIVIQGYYFSKPLNFEKLNKFILDNE